MKPAVKIKYFDYFINQLALKYSESNQDRVLEDNPSLQKLNKLKLLKILFFASSVKIDDGSDLLDYFDKFYAMQYGPVESDIYDSLSALENFTVTSVGTEVKAGASFDYSQLDKEIKEKINKAISELYLKNSRIINTPTFDLVELSHKSEAWKIVFENARQKGKFSQLMPVGVIRKTSVFFK